MVNEGQGVQVPLVEVARKAGLIRWDLSLDTGIMLVVAIVLASAGALSFSKAE
jgi:hypothetical protein